MASVNIYLLPLIVIVWWIGVWGIVETLIQLYIRNSTARSIFVYGLMVVSVTLAVYMNPHFVDYFT